MELNRYGMSVCMKYCQGCKWKTRVMVTRRKSASGSHDAITF